MKSKISKSNILLPQGGKKDEEEWGFTLVEVLIAVFILGVVLTTVYAAYTGTFRMVKISTSENEIYNMGRMTMQRMIQDFNTVVPYAGKFEWTMRRTALGNRSFPRLTFTSNVNLELNDRIEPAGIRTIDYFVDEDRERDGIVLLRSETIRRDKHPDDLRDLKKSAFPLCRRLHSIVFRFYDTKGNDYETWDSTGDRDVQKHRAPALVAIELYLVNPDNRDHSYKFMTKIYLPLNQVDRENMPF
jgi:prepilin-type N-terminal cleavage/methylation domain-containing protein